MYNKDGLTDYYYDMMDKLESIEGFVTTLNRFGILTHDEMLLIYHCSHADYVDELRKQ